MVNHPFEGGTVAETVVVSLGRDAIEGEEVVIEQRGLVAGELRLFDTPIELGVGLFATGERVFLGLLVADMEVGELLAGGGEGVKVGGEGDARQFATEVRGLALAVLRVM